MSELRQAEQAGLERNRLGYSRAMELRWSYVQEELGQNGAVSIGKDRASFYRCDITKETEVENAGRQVHR
ncbi:unnamed protein product [Microthlaspi erraticum]|uniref:Uncharacterized protein n=1 Tax=Microthlaspi erraticum TaxID=1685480 RepID=A0A6D2I8B3_9BRAS|nr:unnamed protein product [Microthlaspi erraticum]